MRHRLELPIDPGEATTLVLVLGLLFVVACVVVAGCREERRKEKEDAQ